VKLIGSLAEVGHVAEISRLLSAFRGRRGGVIGQRELIELANRTAGDGYRYPNPVPALALAQDLGLAFRRRYLIHLTSLGEQFVQLGADSSRALTGSQSKVIFGILLDDRDFRSSVSSILRRLHDDGNGRLVLRGASLPTDQDILQCAMTLQQLAVLDYVDGLLSLNREYEPLLVGNLVDMSGAHETTLWARLDAQRERARIAEEFVLEREKQRLNSLSRMDLAELVFRISAVNVLAGYDIESFEADGSRRYVEVKSSVGTKVRFEWSRLERHTAEELEDRYWIYFVPVAHLLPRVDQILLIRNPVAHVERGFLSEDPSSFLVQERERVPGMERPMPARTVRLVEWKPRRSAQSRRS
jgi:hypothetical protein